MYHGMGPSDFEAAGMHIVNPSTYLPYSAYQLTPEFAEQQAPKPLHPSRDPEQSVLRHWETTNGHVNEVGGRRCYRGECVRCRDVVLVIRNVSGPRFRGRGNKGMAGRYPEYCGNCREKRWEERRVEARESMRRLRADPASRRVEFERRKQFRLDD